MNNPLDARLLTFALELLLKSSIILLTAFGMARLLRRAFAQLRQLVWKATILSLLLLPLLCVLLPTWKLPLQGAVSPVIAPPMESVVPLSTPNTVAPAPIIAEMPAPEIAPPPVYSERVLPPPMTDAPKPAYPIVLSIYLCGSGLVLLRSIVAFIRLLFLAQRAAVCTDSHILNCGQEAAQKLRLIRPVRLLIASPDSRERVPMTWGFWRPCLLLPFDAQSWEASRLNAVLLHEYAHIARVDWLMQQIAALTCALYWFHPLVWQATRALKLESERACDECVIAAGISSTDYAAILLITARAHKQRGFSPEGAILMANPAHLTVRIQSILDSRNSRRAPSRPLMFCGTVFGLVGVMVLSALRPADAAEPPSAIIALASPQEKSAEAPSIFPPVKFSEPSAKSRRQETKSSSLRASWLILEVTAQARAVASLSADVSIMLHNSHPQQSMTLSNGKTTQRGTFRMIKPNLYRLQFDDVQENFIASDGITEWIVQTDTVYQKSPATGSGHLPFPLSFFFVQDVPQYGKIGATQTAYKGKVKEDGREYEIVEIQCGSPKPFHTILLYIGADRFIHRAILKWNEGHKYQNDIRLTNIRPLSKPSAAAFQFIPEEIERYSKPHLRTSKPKLTSFMLPPAKSQTEFTGEISWGEVKDGLQIGLRFPSEKKIYTEPDTLSIQYVVRNVAKLPRRIQLVAPASLYLYSAKTFEAAGRDIMGDLRWMGREGEVSRRERVLPPAQIVALPLTIEPRSLAHWGINSPQPGRYTTHWEAQIEYRDADKPKTHWRKMPEPGALSMMIADLPASPRTRADGTPNILYGETVNGVQFRTSLPHFVQNPAVKTGVSAFVHLGTTWGGRLELNVGQAFGVRLYLRNTTNQPITLSTYMRPEEPLANGEKPKGTVREITLRPFEEKFLYSPQIEYTGTRRKFRILNAEDAAIITMMIAPDRNKRIFTIFQEARFGANEQKTSLASGKVDAILLPASRTVNSTVPTP